MPARASTDPAIMTIGSMSTVAWNLRNTVSWPAKQTETPRASRLPTSWPASTELPNITRMPQNAMVMATQVRAGTRSRRTSRPASAARNGETLISTKVLATVVRVSDAMKKKNVPARSSPATIPGSPAARTAAAMPRPCSATRTPATNSDMNKRSPEHDLPGVGDRQLAHENAAGRPAHGGDDHERDCAAMARSVVRGKRVDHGEGDGGGQRRVARQATCRPRAAKRTLAADSSRRRRRLAQCLPAVHRPADGEPVVRSIEVTYTCDFRSGRSCHGCTQDRSDRR